MFFRKCRHKKSRAHLCLRSAFFSSCIFSKRPCLYALQSFSHAHFFQSERRKRSENLLRSAGCNGGDTAPLKSKGKGRRFLSTAGGGALLLLCVCVWVGWGAAPSASEKKCTKIGAHSASGKLARFFFFKKKKVETPRKCLPMGFQKGHKAGMDGHRGSPIPSERALLVRFALVCLLFLPTLALVFGGRATHCTFCITGTSNSGSCCSHSFHFFFLACVTQHDFAGPATFV